jgi:hypothetical protein
MNILKTEPVMAFAVVVSLVIAVLIVTGTLSIDDVTGFVAVFGSVLAIVAPFLLGLVVRARVTPVDPLTEG